MPEPAIVCFAEWETRGKLAFERWNDIKVAQIHQKKHMQELGIIKFVEHGNNIEECPDLPEAAVVEVGVKSGGGSLILALFLPALGLEPPAQCPGAFLLPRGLPEAIMYYITQGMEGNGNCRRGKVIIRLVSLFHTAWELLSKTGWDCPSKTSGF